MSKPNNLIFLDFETFYDTKNGYSLQSMATSSYVRDPRYHTHGAAVAMDDSMAPVWIDGADLPAFFGAFDWSKFSIAGHNLAFDGLILTERYGVRPALWVDTLAMARAVIGSRVKSLGLDNLGQTFGIGGKLNAGKALADMNGNRYPTPQMVSRLAEYCIDDVKKTQYLYRALSSMFPEGEYKTVSWTIDMAVYPMLLLDTEPLALLEQKEKSRKKELVAQTGLKQTQISSNQQFADILRQLGVNPPVKVSPTTGKESYAFSKQDEDFLNLLDSDDDRIVDLVEARLAVKSTIKETRAHKLITMAAEGPLAVVLNYSGAMQTHRLCLVGDTRIVVERAGAVVEIDLAHLRTSDKVWDGTAFVQHGGLAYAGEKEVITYDGITGTPDHRVLIAPPGEQPRFVGLAEAEARGCDICPAPAPDGYGFDKGVLRADHATDTNHRDMQYLRTAQDDTDARRAEGGPGVVQVLRGEGTDAGQGPAARGDGESGSRERDKPQSFAGRRDTGTVEAPDAVGEGGASTVQQPEGVVVQALRGPGDQVQLQQPVRSGAVGVRELGATPDTGTLDRQDGRERTLRTGQHALGDTFGTDAQPSTLRRAPTWDIVNCGPRNQFAANGRIVHNSGGGDLNLQNLPRSTKKEPSLLRKALKAPDGYKLVAADLSQIELRANCKVCGQNDIIDLLLSGGDPYLDFAKDIYNDQTLTKDANGTERTVGKIGELSLGYYAGAASYRKMLRAQAGIRLPIEECDRIVKLYRKKHQMISGAWRIYAQWLEIMLRGEVPYMDHPIYAPVELAADGFTLPSGLRVTFPDMMRYDWANRQPVHPATPANFQMNIGMAYTNMRESGGVANLHAGVFNNNLIQSLARDVNFYFTGQIREHLPYIDPCARVVMSVHDETVVCCREEYADEVLTMMLGYMKTPPPFWPDLPVTAEGNIGQNYMETK